MQITRGKVIKYTLLPGILPRIMDLFGTGFRYVAYLIAVIFNIARLIPNGHPYLNPDNMGRFGIRHVLAEGANHLELKWKNFDQIAVYSFMLAGVVVLAMQFVLIAVSFIFNPAFALPSFPDWFVIPSSHYAFEPTHDIALSALDLIFGVKNIFNSCISTGAACLDHRGNTIPSPTGSYPYPIHKALHELFRFYSVGIGMISMMVILYLVTTIIGETAASGTPFGQRFNKAWAPVRLIMFFALLAPLNIGGTNGGLNGAQLITLNVAKFGSNFATNAWGEFNVATERRWLSGKELVAIPNTPDLGNLSQFWSVVHACMYGEKKRGNDVGIWLVRSGKGNIYDFNTDPPALTGTGNAINVFKYNPSFAAALAFVENSGNIIIRIGIHDPVLYPDQIGNVRPVCGEIVQPVTTFLDNPLDFEGAKPSNEGAYQLQLAMWYLSRSFFDGSVGNMGGDVAPVGRCFVDSIFPLAPKGCDVDETGRSYEQVVADHMSTLRNHMSTLAKHAIDVMIADADTSTGYMKMGDDLLQRGWAGAAIWYNRLAQMNGEFTSAMYQVPKVSLWPEVMEEVQRQQFQASNGITEDSRFSLTLPDGRPMHLNDPGDEHLAAAYQRTFLFWMNAGAESNMADRESTQNPILDLINGILGTGGLYNLRHPAVGSSPGNEQVHPLALLSSLGKSLVESAVINFGVAAGGTIGEGLLSITGGFRVSRATLSMVASFAGTIAKVTILIGSMLFYVLPFLPFIYFFFALSGWIKSIFEAMVAMPLWALAHLHIDGEGMPGRGAVNGYYLLLEIFIRPILILIGMIGSIMIMSSMVAALNEVFDLMVENVGGSDRDTPDLTSIEFYRGPVDEFMFTVIYAVIVYIIATSSFKLIDSVPNNILRWMQVGVSTIQETAGDPASRISSGMWQKGQLTLRQLTSKVPDSGRASVIMQGLSGR